MRRLTTAVALAVALLQSAAVATSAAMSAGAALAGPADCCVQGAHPTGMCPLHRKSLPSTTCRLSCAAATAGPIVLVAGAVMPEPVVIAEAVPERAPFVALRTAVLETAVPFDTPPPKN
jgi:hypothetical protein